MAASALLPRIAASPLHPDITATQVSGLYPRRTISLLHTPHRLPHAAARPPRQRRTFHMCHRNTSYWSDAETEENLLARAKYHITNEYACEVKLWARWQQMTADFVNGYGLHFVFVEGRLVPQLGLTDLLLWAVASGMPQMVYILWRYVDDPIRVALVASEMCTRVKARQWSKLGNAGVRDQMEAIQRLCQDAIIGVLDKMVYSYSVRTMLQRRKSTLGMDEGEAGNMLELVTVAALDPPKLPNPPGLLWHLN